MSGTFSPDHGGACIFASSIVNNLEGVYICTEEDITRRKVGGYCMSGVAGWYEDVKRKMQGSEKNRRAGQTGGGSERRIGGRVGGRRGGKE